MKTLGFGFHLAGAAGAAALLALALHPLGCAQGEQALSAGAGGGATSTAAAAGGSATTATSSSAGNGGAGGAASSSAGTGGATTPTGTGGSEPDDAGSRDSGPPDSGPPDSGPPDAGPPDSGPVEDAGSTTCAVFETSIECMSGWTVIYVGTTGSTGGHFTYVSENNCVNITDVNCNPTSSVGTTCDPTALGTMTVTHNPCDDSPPCTVTFPVVCP